MKTKTLYTSCEQVGRRGKDYDEITACVLHVAPAVKLEILLFSPLRNALKVYMILLYIVCSMLCDKVGKSFNTDKCPMLYFFVSYSK
jgi:hypothetical protein